MNCRRMKEVKPHGTRVYSYNGTSGVYPQITFSGGYITTKVGFKIGDFLDIILGKDEIILRKRKNQTAYRGES